MSAAPEVNRPHGIDFVQVVEGPRGRAGPLLTGQQRGEAVPAGQTGYVVPARKLSFAASIAAHRADWPASSGSDPDLGLQPTAARKPRLTAEPHPGLRHFAPNLLLQAIKPFRIMTNARGSPARVPHGSLGNRAAHDLQSVRSGYAIIRCPLNARWGSPCPLAARKAYRRRPKPAHSPLSWRRTVARTSLGAHASQ